MSTIKFRNATNDGWLDLTTVAAVKVRNNTNDAWIDKSSARDTIKFRDWADSMWLNTTGSPPYSPPNPYTLTLAHNDLDFIYSSTIPDVPTAMRIRFEFDLNLNNFFSVTTTHGHIPFGINITSTSPNTNHCGPVIRNGRDIFSTGRGFFILQGTDNITAEHWQGNNAIGLGTPIKDSGSGFNTAVHTNVHIKVDGWFRTGVFANIMFITITDNTNGNTLYSGHMDGWGWDHMATYEAFVGAIADTFQSPGLPPPSGCTESSRTGTYASAYATVSNMSQICF